MGRLRRCRGGRPLLNKPAGDAARRDFESGWQAHAAGRLDEAVALYSRSIAACPTAEAHTFRGWAYSMQGSWEEAIRECHAAIAVDPDFGNPYNDIGAYLIELGRLDEAIPWLERAKRAPRYEPRHYPCYNLGRVYARRGEYSRAIAELNEAAALAPGHTGARRLLHQLLALVN